MLSIRAVAGGGDIVMNECVIENVTAAATTPIDISSMATITGLVIRDVRFLTNSE